MTTVTLTLTLPWPPSVNRMWRTPHSGPLAGRTMLSAEGREYRKAVADQVMLQRVPRHTLTGKLQLNVYAHPPDRRARDLDNLLKALCDSLQHAGVFANDSELDELHVYRRGVMRPAGGIEINVAELGVSDNQMPLKESA